MGRRWLYWLLVVAFAWLVYRHWGELQQLQTTLARGRWQWIAAAVGLQLGFYLILTGLYQLTLAVFVVKSRFRQLLPLTFAAVFVNLTAPTGGAAGLALFVQDAGRQGASPARATLGLLLALIIEYAAFCLLLIAGLVQLFWLHDLHFYEIGAALLLLLFLLSLTAALTIGLWRPLWLRRILRWSQRWANRVGGWLRYPPLLAEEWSETVAAELILAAQTMTRQPQSVALAFLVGLMAQIVNLLSLYTIFLTFEQPVTPGVLLAGYAMTMLFTIVSPTPSGVGVVEGLMPVIYVSLGLPVAAATLITLAYRGISYWLPLIIGFLLLRRLHLFADAQRASVEQAQVRLLAVVTAIMGVVNVISGVLPALAERMALLSHFSPLAVRRGGHLTSVLAGFALILLANGLWRRKQAALWATLAILVLSVVAHLIKGLDYEEATLAALLGLYLWTQRAHFHALSDAPSFWQGVRVLIAALLFTLAYGVTGFYLLDRHFSVNFSLDAAVRQTVIMFTQFYDPGLQPITGFGRYFANSIYLVGAATGVYALFMLLRPVLIRRPASRDEVQRATAIVTAHGRSSLARFALLPDKLYYFSPGGSLVAFVPKGRIALALGDPIGPSGDVEATIAGFADHCRRHDWQPAFFQTLPDYLDHYRSAGLEVLCLGYEGIVDVTNFSLAGGANKPLRTPVNRLTRLGYTSQVYEPPLAAPLIEELRSISDEWLATMHGSERRFSVGWFLDEYIRTSPVVAIHSPERSIVAFANLVCEYQQNEIALDLMRRRHPVENGVMEFLFVALLQWARERGYATVNLGMSALYGVGEDTHDPPPERALHFIYEHVNQFYNFKGLHEFKEKFHPTWSPRYLVYPGPASLIGVAVALERASAGDDFALTYLKDRWRTLFPTSLPRPHTLSDRKGSE
jgi:phosphatidylglycerol lysyltransferase